MLADALYYLFWGAVMFFIYKQLDRIGGALWALYTLARTRK